MFNEKTDYYHCYIHNLLINICFARMDFLEQQYGIEGEAWDVRCDKKFISSETYQR